MINLFRGTLVAWLAVLAGVSDSRGQSSMPNIVVYLSDDHSQFDSSLYGAADIPMPNLEKLAADGMVFSHAFVASPSCAPSRAAMLTGLMPARNGAEANHTYPTKGTHYLISDLRAIGYEVAAFGKVAHGRERGGKQAGFDSMVGPSSYVKLRENVARYLQERRSERPLCLFVGISNPHVPWPRDSSFDAEQVKLPPTFLDTPSTRSHRASYYEEIRELDLLLGELREMSAAHLGDDLLFLHTSDHGSQWPFGKWTLYDYGIRVPLVVSWPGRIRSGSKSDAMVSWIDILPTLIDVAGGKVPSGLDGRSFADVLTGKKGSHRKRIFTTHSGDGNMNIYPIRSVRNRDWKLIHNLHPEFAFTNHSDLLRKDGAGAYWSEWAEMAKHDERAKRVVDRYYHRPEFELYQLSQDKYEQNNLADDPEQASRLAEMKEELGEWMTNQGDQRKVYNEPRPLDQREKWHPEFFKKR